MAPAMLRGRRAIASGRTDRMVPTLGATSITPDVFSSAGNWLIMRASSLSIRRGSLSKLQATVDYLALRRQFWHVIGSTLVSSRSDRTRGALLSFAPKGGVGAASLQYASSVSR